jgi:hypothetical protein
MSDEGPGMGEEPVMDTRFWTVCDDVDELLSTVDIDGTDDIETLLMFLLQRPVSVVWTWNDDVEVDQLEITVWSEDRSFVYVQTFPLSAAQLVRSCAELAADVGPSTAGDDVAAVEAPCISALSDEELTTALQQALGKSRIYKKMYPDEEP